MQATTIKQEGNSKALAMLALGETIVWVCLFYSFPALLIRWESAFLWSRLELTGAITLAILVSALFSPVFGKLIDRGFGSSLLPSGAVFGSISLFLVSFVTELWQFYCLWGVIGCCFAACLYEPCFALLTRAYGASAKRGIIVVTLVAGFASTICFPAAHLIADLSDWQTVVRAFSITTMFVGAPLLYFGASLVEDEQVMTLSSDIQAGKSQKGTYLRSTLFMRLATAFALLAIVHGATLHHLLPILNDRGLALGTAVFVASLIGPMQVFGRILITVLQRQLSHKFVVYCAFVLMGSAMVLLYKSQNELSNAVLFAMVFGSGYGTLSIIRPVIARDILGDENFGAKSGLLAFFYLIGAAASPFVGSLVWVAGGYDALIVVLFCLSFGGLWLINGTMHEAPSDRSDLV